MGFFGRLFGGETSPSAADQGSTAVEGGRYGVDAQWRRPYAGASRVDPDLSGWNPLNWSGFGAAAYDRDELATRIHDVARNDGWASSGLTKLVDTLVGGGWVLLAQPNARTLGLDPDVAAELGADIEAEWDDYTGDPDCWSDRERTHPFGLLIALAMRHRMADGEALGVVAFRNRGGPYATCLSVIDPDRLSNPLGVIDSTTMKAGVELESVDYAPIAYHIRVAHPADGWNGDNLRWERVTRDVPGLNRRQVLHAFEPTRSGQRRGVSSLAPILKKLRMLGRYDETEMQAALLNALMAAFITSPNDKEELAESLSDHPDELSREAMGRIRWHEQMPLRMGGAKVNFLSPGEDVKFTAPTHPNAVYDPFVRVGLRNVASAFGLTYEQFTGDLSQVNYSSIRAGLIEIKKGFDARKTHFAGQFMQPYYAAWLQEAFARGRIKAPKGAPSFEEAKSAWCGAEWIGPGMGWVDPLKEVQAVRERLALRLSTRRREAALQGVRFSQIISEAAREDDEMREAGLDPTVTASAAPKSDGSVQEADEQAAPPADEWQPQTAPKTPAKP